MTLPLRACKKLRQEGTICAKYRGRVLNTCPVNRPMCERMNQNSTQFVRRSTRTNAKNQCFSVGERTKLDLLVRPCGTPFRGANSRPLPTNDLQPPFPKPPNQNPLNPDVQTLLHASKRNHLCKTPILNLRSLTSDLSPLTTSVAFTHSSIYHKKVYGRTGQRTSLGCPCLSETPYSPALTSDL